MGEPAEDVSREPLTERVTPPGMANALAKVEPFPEVVMRIRRLVADPRCAVGELAAVVESDVGLATKLLRVANAPASGLAQKCTSVRHAVMLLGLRRISSLVTGAAALSRVEKDAARYPELAAHAVAVGGVARALAPITGAPPDEAFTVGLLHDVGMLVLVQSGDELYEGLLEQLAAGEEPRAEDERELVGVDHAAVGGEALRRWALPAPLPEVVALHHDWEAARTAPSLTCALVALVRAADFLVPVLKANGTAPTLDELAALIEREPAFAHLGLKPDELFKLWSGLRLASEKAHAVGDDDEGPMSRSRVRAVEPERAVVPAAPRAVVQATAPAKSRWIGIAAAAVLAVAVIVFVVLHA
jgi:HD-like signal output (HDOD) protein